MLGYNIKRVNNMESKPRIIVAHAERQHSFYLATAVKKKYMITIYDR